MCEIRKCAYLRAAGEYGTAHQPVAGHVGVQPEKLFPHSHRVRMRDRKSDIVAEAAESADMVVDTFDLEQNRTQDRCR